ncbi:MAG: iron-sulfur cluster assembly scaffold protein [Sphingomonadales bacterium]|nr:iron-sulfur cluster assembly scaffold protein [Sphingomonadales bacterium]
MSADGLYNRNILRLAAMLRPDDRIVYPNASAERRSSTCGSKIAVDITLDQHGHISATAFRAKACALGQASAAQLQNMAVGKDRIAITEMRFALAACLQEGKEIPESFSQLDAFAVARGFPARYGAILLPYDALLAAMDMAVQQKLEVKG